MHEQQESSPETANPEETPEPSNKLASLAELLAAEEPQESEQDNPEKEQESGTTPEKEKGKPKTLKALAETLKLEDKDLYSIEVPMANGESRSLGQLKDLVSKQDEFTVRELEFEETRQKREGELLRAQDELRELIASLPKNAIKPEMLEKVRSKHEATLERERAKTLEVIPEWGDEERRTQELTGIAEHLEGYGLPMTFLTSVVDHRMLRYVRENWQRQQRMTRALEQVKLASPGKTAKSKPNGAAKKPAGKAPQRNQARDGLEQLFQGLN